MSAGGWIAVALGVWFLVGLVIGVLVGKAMSLYNCRECGEPLGVGGCERCFEREVSST